MSINRPKQRPVRLRERGKRDVRTQFGALCWRRQGDDVQVLLVTTRRRKRWIIPKGWPVDLATPAEAAATEAWEEAGAEGKVKPTCLGIFSYNKAIMDGDFLPCVVAVFPLRVKKLRESYPEKNERRRKWVSQKKASQMVDDPELSAIIAGFNPDRLQDPA